MTSTATVATSWSRPPTGCPPRCRSEDSFNPFDPAYNDAVVEDRQVVVLVVEDPHAAVRRPGQHHTFSAGTLDHAFHPFPAGTGGLHVAFGKQFTETVSLENRVFLADVSTTNVDLVVPASAGVIRDLDTFLVTMNDESGTDISTVVDDPGDRAVVGVFNPEGAPALSVSDGEDASGRWRLTVVDDGSPDTGFLQAWELRFDV